MVPAEEQDGLEYVRAFAQTRFVDAARGMDALWCERAGDANLLAALLPERCVSLVPAAIDGIGPGTPLGDRKVLGAWEALRWIALFRLALPSVILRYAGGREVTLRDLQVMGMTAGINALIVGNYLTTLGRSPAADLQMLHDLRMPIGALSAVI